MSAPSSSGRCRYGVANVLSTTTRAPTACAASAALRMSTTLRSGFVGVSSQTRRVRSSRCGSRVLDLLGGQEVEAVALRLVDLREHPVDAAVDVVHADDPVARAEQVHDRRRRAEAGRVREAVVGALQRGEAGLERRPRRVAGARVVVALVLADRVLGERRRLVDRRDHRPGRRVGLLPVVDRARLEVHASSLCSLSAADESGVRPRAWPEETPGAVARPRSRGRGSYAAVSPTDTSGCQTGRTWATPAPVRSRPWARYSSRSARVRTPTGLPRAGDDDRRVAGRRGRRRPCRRTRSISTAGSGGCIGGRDVLVRARPGCGRPGRAGHARSATRPRR